MITSLDEVRVGEYLMCSRGPWITGTDQRGRVASRIDRTFEGSVVYVVAVNPPIMLVRVFPMPCGDPSHDHTPYPALIRWDYMGWSRTNRRYIREYMKAAKHGPPVKLLPQRTVTKEEFNGMVQAIYEHGASPDSAYRDEGDDDDDFAPTHE